MNYYAVTCYNKYVYFGTNTCRTNVDVENIMLNEIMQKIHIFCYNSNHYFIKKNDFIIQAYKI